MVSKISTHFIPALAKYLFAKYIILLVQTFLQHKIIQLVSLEIISNLIILDNIV